MAELSLQQNLQHKYAAVVSASGKQAELLFGAGHTGLANLGNSCYMASALQVLFSIPAFRDHWARGGAAHAARCRNQRPATCFGCQMHKLQEGLLSGRFSPRPTQAQLDAALNTGAARRARAHGALPCLHT